MRRSAIGFLFLAAAFVLSAGCSGSRSDASIATDIKAKLYSDPQVKSADVSVDVQDGTVTLTGSVSDENTRYEAFKVAKETPGVTKVNDQMSVEQSQQAPAAAAPPAAEPKSAKNHHQDPYADLPYRGLASAASDAVAQEPPPAAAAAPSPSDAFAAPTPAPPAGVAPAPVAAAPPPQPPQPRLVSVPAGASVRVQMIDSVDSSVNKAGQIFHASLDQPIQVNNEVIVPAGADIFVKLVDQSSAGHIEGKSALTVQLDHLDFQGKSYPLNSTEYQQVGAARGKRSAETIGGAAAVGALLGGIFGHGKGAAIGAAAGAGGGTAAEEATKAPQVRIASETKLDFTLQQPINITLPPK